MLQKPCKFIMASVKYYFDKRAKNKDGKFPLKLSVSNRQEYVLLNLEVRLLPSQWDGAKNAVVNHPNKLLLNNYLAKQKINVEMALLDLKAAGVLSSMDGKKLKSEIQRRLNPDEKKVTLLFVDHYLKFANSKTNSRTKEAYLYTLSKIKEFTDIGKLSYEDITYAWLKSFDIFLCETSSINSISIHMRNIRAAFNDALAEELISCYPFRKYKIKQEVTRKRSLTIEDLVKLRDFPVEEHQVQYRDMFMLIFYLIGINTIDILNLKECDIVDGRIDYRRRKTGKLYSIKIEPEAAVLIEKYRGEKYLLRFLDVYLNYKDYTHRLNENLQQIGEMKREGKGGKKMRTPLFPELTTYWARHTWATIAHKVGVSKDVISMALGHEFGQKVTGIYIDLDMEKVDEANRMVIDYVNDPVKFMKDRKNIK